jgi:Protein of unknown function (DUF3106)
MPSRLPRVAHALLLALLLGALGAARAGPDPAWATLTPAQKQALAPLQRDWSSFDANRKEKWLEVAARYPTLSADERRRLQERMATWASMTPTERARARLQYQEIRQLPPEERQARWQAYQALTEEERRALAQRARPPARGAAGADTRPDAGATAENGTRKNNLVVPRPQAKASTVAPSVVNARPGATTTTVTTPAVPPAHHQAGMPKIAATPGFVDQATLLPQRGPQGAAVSAPAASAAAAKR